jgi:excisionase family DNA binding protein
VIDRHYKTLELAELLGVHPETLRRAAQRGELRPVRIGRDLLWPEGEVKAWLESNREVSRVVPLRRDTQQPTRRRRTA